MMHALKREQVNDDKLWKMINQVKQLTLGEYSSYDDNASTLIQWMDRILIRAKEKKEWQVHTAAEILRFYLDYPQIDDAKMEQMLEIFQDYIRRYGRSWNYGDYNEVMWMALTNQDKQLAETARKKRLKTDFWFRCYACFYGLPMIGYYVLHEDIEGIEEIISRICSRMLPEKHQWFYAKCENCREIELVSNALEFCLKYGRSQELFQQIFAKWKNLYQESEQGKITETYMVLFYALAGNWSRSEEYLRLAQKNDQKIREKQEAPLDMLYWALCWHCYFRMLDRHGVKMVQIKLGDKNEPGDAVEERTDEKKPGAMLHERSEGRSGLKEEGLPEWSCLDAAEYFVCLADDLGAQMDRARKRFDYARVKRMHEACFLTP